MSSYKHLIGQKNTISSHQGVHTNNELGKSSGQTVDLHIHYIQATTFVHAYVQTREICQAINVCMERERNLMFRSTKYLQLSFT